MSNINETSEGKGLGEDRFMNSAEFTAWQNEEQEVRIKQSIEVAKANKLRSETLEEKLRVLR